MKDEPPTRGAGADPRPPSPGSEPAVTRSPNAETVGGHKVFKGQVLSTLNTDGSRKTMRPQLSRGRYLRARLWVGWGLIVLFVGLPFVNIGGKPAILLDLAARRFTFFGHTLLPNDTFLLALFLLATFIAIFWLTALLGRVWCGWGCPQTVYLELLFRPIERWVEGGRTGSLRMDRKGWSWRRWVKLAIYAVLSVAIANVFLAYFVGVDTLAQWMTRSPFDQPGPFGVVAVVSGLVFFDFAYFREQMCTVICPYARLQSVLLDRKSLIIAYDERRGEPRGKPGRARGPAAASAAATSELGDCIDCGACVSTCPTGIDIREGLQLECVACTQCIDACDSIMDNIGKPRGLIRYGSQDGMEGKPTRILRPRVLIYPALMLVAIVGLVALVPDSTGAQITLLRGQGTAYRVDDAGGVTNTIRVRIANRDRVAHRYLIELEGVDGATLVAPMNPLEVGPGQLETLAFFVQTPPGVLAGARGEIPVTLRISDGEGFEQRHPFTLLGPRPGADAASNPSATHHPAPEDETGAEG